MISRKELQYVSTHTKDVPFPGINYAAEVMENLHAAFKAYEQKYQDKSYNFILSNGEEFTFEILAKNIAHLLGINYKGILSDYMEPVRSNLLGIKPGENVTSYDVLKIIIDRAEDIIKHDATDKSRTLLNYYKIMRKHVYNLSLFYMNFNKICILLTKILKINVFLKEFNSLVSKDISGGERNISWQRVNISRRKYQIPFYTK